MSAELVGEKELAKLLNTLGERVQRRVLRGAVSASATPVVKATKARAPQESGLLKKSIGKKVKTYTATQTVVAIVGPKTNVIGEYQGKKRWPAKYAHLVEGGHIDEHGKAVPAQPFMRPGFDESEGRATEVMKDKLAEGVVREAQKAAG